MIGHHLKNIMEMPMIAKASQIRTLGGHHPPKCPLLSVFFFSLHPLILFPLQSKGQISLITDSTVTFTYQLQRKIK